MAHKVTVSPAGFASQLEMRVFQDPKGGELTVAVSVTCERCGTVEVVIPGHHVMGLQQLLARALYDNPLLTSDEVTEVTDQRQSIYYPFNPKGEVN